MPEHTPEEAPMNEPDATAPQAGDGESTGDEESALRWQAADELLTALAVSSTAHRNLVEMRRAFERAEALGVLSSFSETSDGEEGSEGEVGGAEKGPGILRSPTAWTLRDSISGSPRGAKIGRAHV